MKKLALVTLVVLSIVLSTAPMASAKKVKLEKKTLVKVDAQKEGKFMLTYLTNVSSGVRVNIYDAKGKSLLSESIRIRGSFTKPYNFQGLPAGEYTFEVVDVAGVVTEKVVYTPVKKEIKAEIIKAEGQKYEVTVLGKDIARVGVFIYDAEKNLVFGDMVQHGKSFSKVYDLSKVSTSELTFEVVSGGQIIAKSTY